jgi:predicted dehydrogenase
LPDFARMTVALNVALVGYGYAGKTFHAPLINSVTGLQLAAVCSSHAEKVWADYPSIKVNTSPDEIFTQAQIDVVVIATPNHTHFDLARRALLAGKHVVVDKPFTVTAAEARELTALAEQNGLVLSVFHNRRWDADFLTVRALIASGKLGALASFVSRFDRYRPDVKLRWREQAGEGSGLWYDLGPHLLDQALQLFGCPIAIQANFAIQRANAQVVDYFDVFLHYTKLKVNLHASMLMQNESPRFVLSGSAGSYKKFGPDTQEDALKRGELPGCDKWGHDPRNGELHMTQGNAASNITNLVGDYRYFYAKFRDAIVLKTTNPVPPEDAVLVMGLIELAGESAKLGREIILPSNFAFT